MPVSIDIHENEFLEEIYQEGQEKGSERGTAIARRILITLLEQRFGSVPAAARQRILVADLDTLDRFTSRLAPSASLDQILL